MTDSSIPRVGITELRRHFSRIIDQVAAGQAFVITRYGRPVALIVPPHYLLG
ncbi:type II toxin-antitoxin system prevent-host-death family antitoxin [Mycobacterium sp.]|uniref:type II toxin-antitoxin system Phd/YefM family antitoxin n=1 Tax=Mycobacterium sp. TaxID=1785 RepID=UPI0031D22300